MRRSLTHLALLAIVGAAACSDAPKPTSPPLIQFDRRLTSLTELEDYIHDQIVILLPPGFEQSVGLYWNQVQSKKKAGDFAGAVVTLNKLADKIILKTNDITPPEGETKAQAATRLILNMSRWVYEGAHAPVSLVADADVAVKFVPAGTPASVVTPSEKAAVQFAGQPQDRIIVISQEEYPGQCAGPLNTVRCQYPLFYKIESFPKVRLTEPGRFAVCLVTTGDRAPLDYLTGDATTQVHDRVALAHEKPADPADYTPGSTIEGEIEILPISPTQSGLAKCNESSPVGLAPIPRALHYALRFMERLFSPKEAWAYDSGPEHLSDFFSNFNAVDPQSSPDLGLTFEHSPGTAAIGTAITLDYIVANKSRRSGAEATGASQATTAQAYLSSDQVLGGDDVALGEPFPIGALRPDDSQTVAHVVTLPGTTGDYYLLVVVAGTAVPPNTGTAEVSLVNNHASRAIKLRLPSP